MTKEDRRDMFEAIVVQCLWVLVMRSFGMRARDQAANTRSAIIAYFDEFGNQSSGAPNYRRETTYPIIKDND